MFVEKWWRTSVIRVCICYLFNLRVGHNAWKYCRFSIQFLTLEFLKKFTATIAACITAIHWAHTDVATKSFNTINFHINFPKINCISVLAHMRAIEVICGLAICSEPIIKFKYFLWFLFSPSSNSIRLLIIISFHFNCTHDRHFQSIKQTFD